MPDPGLPARRARWGDCAWGGLLFAKLGYALHRDEKKQAHPGLQRLDEPNCTNAALLESTNAPCTQRKSRIHAGIHKP